MDHWMNLLGFEKQTKQKSKTTRSLESKKIVGVEVTQDEDRLADLESKRKGKKRSLAI